MLKGLDEIYPKIQIFYLQNCPKSCILIML